MTETLNTPRLFLGDQPRLEIPLSCGLSTGLSSWLTVELPAPDAGRRPEGTVRCHSAIPGSDVEFVWGESPAVPEPLIKLTLRVGDREWKLRQDIERRDRWVLRSEFEDSREWSS